MSESRTRVVVRTESGSYYAGTVGLLSLHARIGTLITNEIESMVASKEAASDVRIELVDMTDAEVEAMEFANETA